MRFRLKAFAIHLLGSAVVLTLALGSLYVGWYRWPGWYLAGALPVTAMIAGVDLALGPLLTLVIANPDKPRRELARDVAMIVVVQLAALIYGAGTLWHGRPLYYTFSEDRLEIVQASDLDTAETALGRQQNPDLAPHWYSLPRWIWAPLPQNEGERDKIVTSAITGGNDIIQMPRYYQAWERGLPALRKQLKPVDRWGSFGSIEKERLKRRMARLGIAPDQPVTLQMMGRIKPVLAIFDSGTLQIKAIMRAD